MTDASINGSHMLLRCRGRSWEWHPDVVFVSASVLLFSLFWVVPTVVLPHFGTLRVLADFQFLVSFAAFVLLSTLNMIASLPWEIIAEHSGQATVLVAGDHNGFAVSLLPQCFGLNTVSLMAAIVLGTRNTSISQKLPTVLLFALAFYCWSVLRVLIVMLFFDAGIPWLLAHDVFGIALNVLGVAVAALWVTGRQPATAEALRSLLPQPSVGRNCSSGNPQ